MATHSSVLAWLSSCSWGDRPLVDLYVELAGFSNDTRGCQTPSFCAFIHRIAPPRLGLGLRPWAPGHLPSSPVWKAPGTPLPLPGPVKSGCVTLRRGEIPVVFENPDATREKRRGSNVFTG